MLPPAIRDALAALARDIARKTPLSESEARSALDLDQHGPDPPPPPDLGTVVPRDRQRDSRTTTLAG